MTMLAPSPVEVDERDEPIEGLFFGPPDDGPRGGHDGDDGESQPSGEPYRPPAKSRRSVWPFLLDLGLVMMLFGWIIIGQFLVVIGAVIFVVALTGWIREARAEFSNLRN